MLIGMFFLLILSLLFVVTTCAARSALPVCSEPPDIRYASVRDISDDNYPLGSVVTYGCDFGYRISGESRLIKCIKSRNAAEWTDPQFSCIPQACGDPGLINNGQRVGSLFTFPNFVTYLCDEGYVLSGISTRYCQASGTWSGILPECKIINCGPPKTPDNGQVTAYSFDYGSELRYKCDKGFALSTRETVYCTENGTWSNSDVTCTEITCQIPGTPEYGNVRIFDNGNQLREGSLAIYTCNEDRIPYGSTTSKCLNTGKWNFPPPICLKPCSVPYISNGVIGKYVSKGYYKSKVFEEIPPTTKVEDEEDLYIRCFERFQVSGSEYRETDVSCSKGRWSREPFCVPVSCRSEIPYVSNAAAVTIDAEHGGAVLYQCFTDFIKVIDETVICDHGVWKGNPPVCKSTKCSVDTLQFPGILKGLKSIYKDGEVFKVACEERYQLAVDHDGEVRCEKGTWTTSFSPCLAANCSHFPRPIEHGNVEVRSKDHGTIAKYTCDPPYVLIETSLVQCIYGRWDGKPPRCVDGRCYRKNLLNSAHLSLETPSITFSGDRLNVICEYGYSPNSEQPLCRNGVWSQSYESLCVESNCLVPFVNHGSIAREVLGDLYFNFWSFRFERTLKYDEISIGRSVPSRTVLWLFCEEPYSVLGRAQRREGIRCYKGTWSMDLVCLKRGELYIPTTVASKVTSSPVTQSTNTPEWLSSTKAFKDKSYVTELPKEECSCEYPIEDEELVAHVKDKQLKFGDKVQNGNTVVFRCLHVGYHHLSGHRELTCEDCKPWHSSNFPSCSTPQKGDVVVVFDRNVNVLTNGTLEIQKGESANFTCIAYMASKYPIWNASTAAVALNTSEKRIERDNYGDVLYLTHLLILNIDYNNEGIYECYIEGNRKTEIEIKVIDPDLRCPEFPKDDKITVKYETERYEGSKATFTCPIGELVGSPELTCLRNAEWSGTPPNCSVPTCSERDLLSKVPQHVQPQTDATEMISFLRPYNYSVKLICKNGMVALGSPIAKCGKGGKWDIGTVQCVSGCPPFEKPSDSKLKIYPDKEIYNVGERLTFSCPPGMSLSTESEAIMCLIDGWSEAILPECEGSDNYDDFSDYNQNFSETSVYSE